MSKKTFDVRHHIVLAIHGGAGTLGRAEMTPAKERAYRKALSRSLTAGYAALIAGRSALDAVEAAVVVLEDSPLFNAGKGAVFNKDGKIEHDATIMCGETKNAGGVGAVTVIKNPIRAARAVMERTKHILLTGKGAERFAKREGLVIVDPSYFWTARRWKQWLEVNCNGRTAGKRMTRDGRYGTVGAVALDSRGNLAAATSTGGLTCKLPGRLGDSAIIGAGTYADNETCAVSTTGHGESFMRQLVAYDLGALMRYQQMSLPEAADQIIFGTFKKSWWRRRSHRSRSVRQLRPAIQHRRHVPRLHKP